MTIIDTGPALVLEDTGETPDHEASPAGGPTTTVVAESRTVTETSVTVTRRTVPEQVHGLMEQINRCGAMSISPEAQKELAQLLNILPALVLKDDPYLTEAVQLAVTSLTQGEPSVDFARSVRRDIESQVSRWKAPLRSMYRGRPPMRATLGLLLFLLVGGLVFLALAFAPMGRRSLDVQGVDGKLLALAAVMGGLGSIVSIFVRVPHMSDDFRAADQEVPFFVGLFKPMVGISFAIFVYVAIQGGFLPIVVSPERSGAFFMAVSFVAGFSERFVPDIIRKTEDQGPKSSLEGQVQQAEALAGQVTG